MTVIRSNAAALSAFIKAPVKPHTSPLQNLAVKLQDVFGGTHSSYKAKLRGMDDKQLAGEAKRLQAVIADASSGPNQNPSVAARARAELGEIREEQKTRADFAKSPNPAYAKGVHHMSDKQLSLERAKQLERYHEATTGFDQDPAKAADAKAKLEALSHESIGRFKDALQGALPKAVPTKPMRALEQIGYSIKASRMSDGQLRQEKAKALGELRDATTGAHRDPVAAANAQKKLDILSHVERSRHPHTKPISNQDLAAFQKQCSQRSSGQLKGDIERTKAELKKLGTHDPVATANAMRKLGVLEGALRTREADVHKLGKWAAGASDADLAKAAQDCKKHLNRSSPDFAKTLENLNVITAEQHKRATHPAVPVEPKPAEMSLDDLVGDLLKNLERYHEASTGFDQDPAKAQEAMGHVRADVGELLKRLFEDALKAAF